MITTEKSFGYSLVPNNYNHNGYREIGSFGRCGNQLSCLCKVVPYLSHYGEFHHKYSHCENMDLFYKLAAIFLPNSVGMVAIRFFWHYISLLFFRISTMENEYH